MRNLATIPSDYIISLNRSHENQSAPGILSMPARVRAAGADTARFGDARPLSFASLLSTKDASLHRRIGLRARKAISYSYRSADHSASYRGV